MGWRSGIAPFKSRWMAGWLDGLVMSDYIANKSSTKSLSVRKSVAKIILFN